MRVLCFSLVLALAFAASWDPVNEVAVSGGPATSNEHNIAQFEMHFSNCQRPSIVEIEQRLRNGIFTAVTVNNPNDDDAEDVEILIEEYQYVDQIYGEFSECNVLIDEVSFGYSELLPPRNEDLEDLRSRGTLTDITETHLARRKLSQYPTSKSWEQHASPIRNQISGTCAAYSSAALMEIKENMDYGKDRNIYLSPLSIYVRRSNMPYSGMGMPDVFQILRDHGAAMETDWPMDGFSGSQVDNTRMSDLPPKAAEAAKRHRVEKVYSLTPTQDTAENKRLIIAAFNEYGPAHVACAVYGPMDGTRDPEGMCRMWVKKPGYGRTGGHAMAAVAYDEEGITIRNSWGQGWCQEGKTKLVWDEVKMFSDFYWWTDAPTKSCEYFEGDTGKSCWDFSGMAPTLDENAQCTTVPCNYADKDTCCRAVEFTEFGNGECASENKKIAVRMHTASSTAPCQKACQESEQCLGYSVTADGSQCGVVLACHADVTDKGIDSTVSGGKCFKKPGVTSMPLPEFTKHATTDISGWNCSPTEQVECELSDCLGNAITKSADYSGYVAIKVLDGGTMGGKHYYWLYSGEQCVTTNMGESRWYSSYLPTCTALTIDTSVTRPNGNPTPTQGVQTQAPVTPVTQAPTGGVNCGSSRRATCADCEGDFGSIHCKGECHWTGSSCIPKETTPVTQTPVTQRPVTQTPVTQRPVTQAPVVTQRPVTQAPVTQAPSQGAACDTSGETTINSGSLGGYGYTCSMFASHCESDMIFDYIKDDCYNTCANIRGLPCSGGAPARVDCVMGSWTNSGDCTSSCGAGRQRQTRSIQTQASGGGTACESTEREIVCNSQACPTTGECKDFATTREASQALGATGCLAKESGWDSSEFCGLYGASTCASTTWGPVYRGCCPVFCGTCGNVENEIAIADIVQIDREKPELLVDDVTSVSPFFAATHVFALIGLGATAYVALRACSTSSYKEIVDQEV